MRPQQQGIAQEPTWISTGPGRWEALIRGRLVVILQHPGADESFRVSVQGGRKAGDYVPAKSMKEAKAKAMRLAG